MLRRICFNIAAMFDDIILHLYIHMLNVQSLRPHHTHSAHTHTTPHPLCSDASKRGMVMQSCDPRDPRLFPGIDWARVDQEAAQRAQQQRQQQQQPRQRPLHQPRQPGAAASAPQGRALDAAGVLAPGPSTAAARHPPPPLEPGLPVVGGPGAEPRQQPTGTYLHQPVVPTYPSLPNKR
jgi:hypothetical protein